MDALSLIGIIIAFGAVFGGNYLDGGQIGTFLNLPAGIIVVGGTLGAAVLQTPKGQLGFALQRLRWIIYPPLSHAESHLGKIVAWAGQARKLGLLGLEDSAEKEPDTFVQRGLQLLIDGGEPESIRGAMETDSALREQRDLEAARFFESMGGYAPTIGIIGAVMGLIHVMQHLTDPEKLGPGIAIAFVATIYGVGLANLILLPIAAKLRSCIKLEVQGRALAIEGIVSIAEGTSPKAIERKLGSFLPGSIK
ncbi:MAG: flagellar motor protein [Pseudomonadales bacterium]